MYNRKYNILFLCQDNASYSPVAEVLLQRWSDGQFSASSAGLETAYSMHPFVTRFLHERGLHEPLHSPRHVQPDAISEFDYVFLLDERLSTGSIPCISVTGSDIVDWSMPAFNPYQHSWALTRACYANLEHRIRLLCCTQFNALDHAILYTRLHEIAVLNNTPVGINQGHLSHPAIYRKSPKSVAL